MFKVKVYKYDSTQEANGYRGIGDDDFSSFVMQGEDLTEDITQVMDTNEITLAGLPFQKAFDPETKFIIDIVEYGGISNEETIVETLHRVVERDVPNQTILSDNNYFDHHISFIEPSVIAQKRLVDNISATYKLKDVTLKEVPAYPDTEISTYLEPSVYIPSKNFGLIRNKVTADAVNANFVSGKYFELDGEVEIENKSGEKISSLYTNIEKFKNEDGSYTATFIMPKLKILFGISGSKEFTNLGYASIKCVIEEYDPTEELNITNRYEQSFISNSNLGEGEFIDIINWKDRYDGEWLLEDVESYEISQVVAQGAYKKPNLYFKKYTNTNASAPNYRMENIPILPNKRYKVTISLYQFDDNFPTTNYSWNKFTGTNLAKYIDVNIDFSRAYNVVTTYNYYIKVVTSRSPFTDAQTIAISNENTFDASLGTIAYSSSFPYSALALLQKAIVNSGLYEKQDGIYMADINNSNLPFYIDDKYVNQLSTTLIIENFYNQKNLWEIMIEVGNYIHAIPELRFGSNDRFVITFNQLGRTDEKQNNSTKISIFNSRSVEDYISATSSYITNMVQLGGYVEEWVAPKTTNEQFLISNDTVEILTSKPIIELLTIYVRRNSDGAVADLTNFIYEENVYKTLSIDYDVVPNRGIALYYKLGTNIITGGDYQLPQANTNIYSDYAIKKVIWSAFNQYPVISPIPTTGYWTNLKVNDYSFFIRYRTKDSVRQNHIRPDLRKYLLNTKWDKYPEHNQFNNQTDVVVDSIKFGNNMFGKLIRTGNNSYDIYEWNDEWSNVKHKGELYRINDELYYVAKITHTLCHNFIVSKISYSKDYNELSNIIGIPSEPRFYEISEQSLIWREFEINDVLLLTDDENQLEYNSNYVFNYDHLGDLIIGEGTDFAKYALTVFKGDKDANKYDQTVGQSDLYVEVINPINAYSSENTLTYEYDMEDNYSAGDKVVLTDKEDDSGVTLAKGSYNSLSAVKYTDIYGKATLMDFYILGNIGTPDITSPSGYTPPTPTETMAFPESPISTKQGDVRPFIGNYNILATNVREYDTNFNGRGLGLLKDCREAISVNYNLRMATSSDTFVLSPYVYLPKKSNVKIVLLAEEVNKLSTGYIDNSKIITPIDKQGNTMNPYFDFNIVKTTAPNSWDSSKQVVTKFGINLTDVFQNVADGHFTGEEGYQRVKGIAIVCDVSLDAGLETETSIIPYKTQFVVARNIPEFWDRTKALKPFLWGSPKKSEVFKNKQ